MKLRVEKLNSQFFPMVSQSVGEILLLHTRILQIIFRCFHIPALFHCSLNSPCKTFYFFKGPLHYSGHYSCPSIRKSNCVELSRNRSSIRQGLRLQQNGTCNCITSISHTCCPFYNTNILRHKRINLRSVFIPPLLSF